MNKVAVFGTGRIGKIHIKVLHENPNIKLVAICDPFDKNIKSLAQRYQVEVKSEQEIFANNSINVVLIASATNTHFGLLEKAINANKHVFCEKPIDLDINKVRIIQKVAQNSNIKVGVGFQRRHDKSFKNLKTKLSQGLIGKLEHLTITSRDPAPPPIEYIKVSGGLVHDMMIHDLDMVNFLLEDDKVGELYASGSNLINPEIKQASDIDGALVLLKSKSGALISISNSRRAAYGYDQRVEILGSKGRLNVKNIPEDFVESATDKSVNMALPQYFFLERYTDAYRTELNSFFAWLNGGEAFKANLDDAGYAQELAELVIESLNSQSKVEVNL